MSIPLKSTFLALSLALAACKPDTGGQATEARSSGPEVAPATATESADPAKWPIPEAMMKHLANLEQDLRAFEKSADKDSAALSGKIEEHINLLISSCTMQGKGHDALHEWLMPFRKLAKEYAEASDPGAKSEKFKAMLDSLVVFHQRFE